MKFLGFALFTAAMAAASPITVTFTGTGSGFSTINSTAGPINVLPFTDAPFTLIFSGDTDNIQPPGLATNLPNAIFQPTSNSVLIIAGVNTIFQNPGFLCEMCQWSLYLDPSNGTAGLAVFPPPFLNTAFPFLTISDPAFTTWDFTTSIGPLVIDQNVGSFELGAHTGLGSFSPAFLPFDTRVTFSSATIDTFQATVGTGPASGGTGAVPEPATIALTFAGVAVLALGRRLRHRLP